jgi:hypothetical protein
VIVSASYRTDIPAFYADWLLRRHSRPHGCVYCYAVADRNRAVANFRRNDPDAAILLG